MSLDFYLEKVEWTDIIERNITHNVTPMWHKAGVYNALYHSHEKQAYTIIPALEKGIEHMTNNSEEYIALNPENGWGSYATALPWLIGILQACKDYPETRIRISK